MYNGNGMNEYPNFIGLLGRRPAARAMVRGSERHPLIRGEVRFYQTTRGVVVLAEITGLPDTEDPCMAPVFGFHVHGGGACTGSQTDPFADAGTHYNPDGCLHPYHAGDLPPLFGAGGMAFSAFLTDRFTVAEILGRTVIIHAKPDDFTTQPSGNAGEMMACGVIRG